jgi:hypothetical protein
VSDAFTVAPGDLLALAAVSCCEVETGDFVLLLSAGGLTADG